MHLVLRQSPFSVFWVIRFRYIVAFIVISNLLAGLAAILNGEIGQINTLGGAFFLMLDSIFASYCGFGPLASKAIQKRWCIPGKDIEDACFPLMILGIMGAIIALLCAYNVFSIILE